MSDSPIHPGAEVVKFADYEVRSTWKGLGTPYAIAALGYAAAAGLVVEIRT